MPTQDNRPAVYLEGNTAIYRASATGHCTRMLWAARSGMEARPIPDTIMKAMDEGTALEAHILNLLYEEYHFDFGYQGQEQFQVELDLGTFNSIRVVARGKVDEIGCPLALKSTVGDLTIDVKAFGQQLVNEYHTKGILGLPRYAWQQSVYARGYGKDHFYMPIFNKATEKLEPWSLQPIPAPYTFEQIRERIMTVEEAFYNSTMIEECPAEYGCQYYYLHDQKTIDTLPEEAKVLLIARINLSQKIDTFSKAKSTLDEAIRSKLSKDVTYHLQSDNGTYTITVIANPNKFNTNAAKALLTEAEVDWQNSPDFWTPGEGTQLRVNKPKVPKSGE